MGSPEDVNARLRRLPKVDDVLRGDAARRLLERAPRWAVVAAVRDEIESLRTRLRARSSDGVIAGASGISSVGSVAGAAMSDEGLDEHRLEGRVNALLRPSLRRVLNATGVVLHTNLGRAPLAPSAIARVVEIARGYSNLEYRLDEGVRGSRHEHVAELVRELTGAEEALVVNNCAAAVLLALGGLLWDDGAGAADPEREERREVIVSRGELVEIGGSFRIPDVMRASGAKLVEVGTTNRTHARDYERAITERTALLLKVHRSNFAVVGFTTEVTVEELAVIGRQHNIPTMVDLGSGSLLPTASMGLGREPTVQDTVGAGADVVCFSGDKLLGGPQAGILCLTKALLPRLRAHPLLRAMRPDKLTLAALTATLELYRDGRARAEIPSLAMLSASAAELSARAAALHELVTTLAPSLETSIVPTRSAVGGGALPLDEPPSFAVAVKHPRLGPAALDARLRTPRRPGLLPLVCRIVDDQLIADVRTLSDEDLPSVAVALAESAKGDVTLVE